MKPQFRSAVKQDYTGFIRLPRHKDRLGPFLQLELYGAPVVIIIIIMIMIITIITLFKPQLI